METVALISEQGIDNFSLRALSLRARVAQKTLYNSFGSKEALISTAFDYFLSEQGKRFPLEKMRGVHEIMAQLAQRCEDFIVNRQWSRASNFLYYSFTVDDRIYATLKDMAMLYFRQYFRVHSSHPDFIAGEPSAYAEMQMSNVAHGTVHDWVMGRITDEAFPDAVCLGVVSMLASCVRGTLHTELLDLRLTIRDRLAELPGPDTNALRIDAEPVPA